MNSKFCPVPWLYVAIKNNGDFRVCCHANTSSNTGSLKKSDNTKFNIATDDVSAARQSGLMNDIRLSMLKNETNPTCIRCDKEDLAGMRSRRQYEKERAVGFSLERAIEVTNQDGTIDPQNIPVNYMDLRFGNRCNLKCRMCGPADSEQWYDDYASIWGTTSFNDGDEQVHLIQNSKGKWIADTDKYEWVDRPHAWEQIKKNLHDLEYIYIVGGEPLLVHGHVDLLNECINGEVAHKITLEYNTNLTTVSDEVLELWKNFKAVRIGISIDGIQKVNDYIRSPSKWEQISFNFKKLMDHNSKQNFEIWFSLTYQAYNAFHVTEVFEWIKTNFVLSKDPLFNEVTLKTHPLHKPDYLSVKAFPDRVKKDLEKKYAQYIEKLNDELISHADNSELNFFKKNTEKTLNSFISFMNEEDLSSRFDIFLRQTKELDQIRAENINTAIPEIGRLINGTI